MGLTAQAACHSDEPMAAAKLQEGVRHWLRAVGWEGQEVLDEKVRTAQKMVAEMEALVADLPPA